MAQITHELKSTVAAMPHIEEVHFAKNGEHFFNVHKYVGEKGDKNSGKFYGRLDWKPVHVGNEGERKIYKSKATPIDELEIVESISREDILSAEAKQEPKAKDVVKEVKAKQEPKAKDEK